MKISINLQPKERLTAFALQIGGFYPLFGCGADLLLVDRNMVSNADNILSKGNHRDNKANRWWYDFVNEPRYTLNPVLAALEGPSQSIPSYKQFCQEFLRCCEILRLAFPKARVIKYDERAYKGAYALLGEITRKYENEINFLLKAAPLIVVPIAKNRLQSFERDLCSLAKESNLGRLTFSLIACLSCLYEDSSSEKKSPGRAVLKPKLNYTRAMAHNPIMDIYGLIFLIQASDKINRNTALCTSDKGLLQFWCALKVMAGGTSTEEGFNVSFECSGDMFPRLNDSDIIGLMQRIYDFDF